MKEDEKFDSFWLCNMKGIGGRSIRRLMERAGDVEKVFSLPMEAVRELLGERRAACFQEALGRSYREGTKRKFVRMKEQGIFFLPYWDSAYPGRLLPLCDAPVCLYGKGRLPAQEKAAVAVIGTRECSGYGQGAADYFAGGLAAAGVVIVSGMARGVDGIAQQAALEAGGSSVAVLGCGVDICYPAENRQLYESLVRDGCVLSEYPPGTEPKATLFPPRNRIISGLSDMVLVIEAREKSGTLITVDMALEQGREVYALPGRITDGCSRGCNRLIANGAGMARSVAQVLRELKPGMYGNTCHIQKEETAQKKPVTGKTQEAQAALQAGKERMPVADKKSEQESTSVAAVKSGKEQMPAEEELALRIQKVLDDEPVSLDDLLGRLASLGEPPTVQKLMQTLLLLSLEGIVKNRAGMYFLEKKQDFFHLH